MRALSRLIRILAPHATGIVLHRAGELVVPETRFVEMLGDLDDPECCPFAAWIDVAVTERGGQKLYATFGMDAFGLPDVSAPVDPTDRWSRSRRHEAVLFASYTMVRQNRELASGELLKVPLRTQIGAWPVDLVNKEAMTTYSIQEDGAALQLRPVDESHAKAAWRDGVSVLNAYQALFDFGLVDVFPSDLLRDVPAHGTTTPHAVEVRGRLDGRGFLVVTNGFGRGQLHLEVGAWVREHSFDLVKLVGALGALSHASESGPWKVGDTVGAPVEELGIGGFVLADGGHVGMGGGPTVQILLLVPVTPADYAHVRGGGALDWLAKNPLDERSWDPFLRS
jgi:hypothetical protein